jgi:hypothetical protein
LQPDDISPAAVFLASDAAAMVTCAECEVTGGDSAKELYPGDYRDRRVPNDCVRREEVYERVMRAAQ